MTAREAEPYARLIERNAKAAQLLAQSARASTPAQDVSDWIVTMHFYMLCVYLKCLGKSRGVDFQDHFQIRRWLNTDPDLLIVARPYRKVEEWSRDARYEGRTFGSIEMRRFSDWFTAVRDQVVGLLSAEGLASVPSVGPVLP